MSETNERSVASTGSVEPVAWAVYSHWHSTPHIAKDKQEADRVRRGTDWIVPLYAGVNPAITAAERALIEKLTWAHPDPRMGRPIFVTPSERDAAAALLERLK